ncbi:MAG TPA: RsmG family class I SAM-dependent methyltransferase [Candidatus Polarisedimenticolaceae bacterium]|nr:RsmG family class I SAM-dependent methyltransferase [Candidatus Polarisedimenticolaceae bacterium]
MIFSWDEAVAARARAIGLELGSGTVHSLVVHAQSVLRENGLLHLTAIDQPAAFVDRHIGESLEGARLLDEAASGTLVDLGSGNGYPGIPIALVRPRLAACLVEASEKKAAFLRAAIAAAGVPGSVLARHVTRAQDLAEIDAIAILVTRAMGDWERVVPRLAAKLGSGGKILLWAGVEAGRVLERDAWRRYRLVARHVLQRRERSFIYELVKED